MVEKIDGISKSLTHAFLVTFIFLLGPFLFSKSAEFLGQDVSMIALGVVSFYPGVAIAQLLKIVLVSLALVLFHLLILKFIFKKSGLVFQTLMLSILFGSVFMSSALIYPGFFMDFIPTYLHQSLRDVSYVMASQDILMASYGVFIGSFLLKFLLLFRGSQSQKAVLNNLAVMITFSVILIIGIVSFFGNSYNRNSDRKNENVLVIAIDSLRVDSINADRTPHINNLLNDSETVNFEDHVVGIPRTFPSWIEILSGNYASETGIRHMFPSLGIREHKFSGMGTIFKKAGFRTFIVSDFAGDIFPRFKADFEEVDAPSLTVTGMIKMNVAQLFPVFLPFFVKGPLRSFFSELKQSPTLADPQHLKEKVLKHIDLNSDKKWLGIVFFSTAHFPYAAPEPYYRTFSKRNYEGQYLFKKDPEVKVLGQEIDAEDRFQIRALYDGSMKAIDDSIGEIMADLKAKDLWDQTTIILTADHGEQIYDDKLLQGHGEHLRSEVVLKVPLLLKMPKAHPPKIQKIHEISQPIDILPTLLGIMDIPNDKSLSGYDFSTKIYGKSTSILRQYAYSETGIWFSRSGAAHFQKSRLDYPGISGLLQFDQGRSNQIVLDGKFENVITIAKHRSITTSDYKLIYMPTLNGIKYELFNRKSDPNNDKNLIESEVEIGLKMKNILWDHMNRFEGKYSLVSEFLIEKS